MRRLLFYALLAAAAAGLASCGADAGGTVREYDLTAEVVDWEVVDGEIVEVWGYNGEYPGPIIEAEVGDTIRVNLTNNLSEGTTIHWHGLEVPNDQDGVPGITQPIIGPGERFTYEFTVDRAGTTMYHTHANTVRQLGRGLVGPLVVREPALTRTPKYDGDYTLVLHEIDGLFTINGHSFPATLEDEDSLITLETGQRVRVRMINAGQVHHPMHMHGHQFKVVALDSSELENPYWVNTIDIAPGQTVDVEVIGNNPGTWTFHCHILPHVTNRGEYPGGMLTLVDYTDHTSMLEGAAPSAVPVPAADAAPATTVAPPPPAAAEGSVFEVSGTEFAFRPDALAAAPGDEITIRLTNDGSILHNLEILGTVVEAAPGQTAEITVTLPDTPGDIDFWCNIAGHREAGMEGVLTLSS